MFENLEEVRVRFAPSPTGYLHIGGARTAIFNWLFARNVGGHFLLRIEDTDIARSNVEMVNAITDSLKWLGVDWDELPVFQSKRLELYKSVADQLVRDGLAYYCFCTTERLNQLRLAQGSGDRSAYFYDGACRNLTDNERQTLINQNTPKTIRFKINPGETHFSDVIRGSLTIQHREIDDFVIQRSDGLPTYHLAVVVDDHDMKISHVIRGDDHLTNTAKQVLLYQALQWNIPQFAHVPMILGSDKKRLSKRHGAASVSEFREAGYLAEALFNYLALLGWSPGNDLEIMDRNRLIASFNLKNVNKNCAVFDETKLSWFNSQYINYLDVDALYEKIKPFWHRYPLFELNVKDENYSKAAIGLLKSRMKRLTDFFEYGSYFFLDPKHYQQDAVEKHWRDDKLIERLSETAAVLSQLKDFSDSSVEKAVRDLADRLGVSAAKLIHPLRVALTGVAVSPGIFELISLLGKQITIKRINNAIAFLETSD